MTTSSITKCDGPDCGRATVEEMAERVWILVEQTGHPDRHFHDWPCLARFASMTDRGRSEHLGHRD